MGPMGHPAISPSNRNTMSFRSMVYYHYDKAYKAALVEVERLARKILREHPNLDEFVMAMGRASFSVKEDHFLLACEDRAYMQSLANFIGEWDEYLRLTGTSMRFTATGRKRTNW